MSKPSDQIMSTVTIEVNTYPRMLLRVCFPRIRAHAVGISKPPTTAMSNQPGPTDRDSGSERRKPPPRAEPASQASVVLNVWAHPS